jgi:uncharacterized protein DUF6777
VRFNARAIILGLLLVLLAGGAVFAGLRFFGSDAEKVLYQDPEDIGPDPFTDPAVFVSDVTESTTTTSLAPSPGSTTTTLATLPAPTATPSPQGPFGGSGKKGECDPELLIKFLNENPDKKQAWVDVLGVELEDFETYVRSLRSTVLTRDARVTNHGFKNGKAYGFQAILAKGNAVLVDEKGDIVVRCYCGNPLQPPAPLEDYECEGCPPDYDPPGACNRTCYPELTTTTTTFPVTTTLVESTTTTRRVTTTRRTTTTTRPTTTRPTTPTQPTTVATLPTTMATLPTTTLPTTTTTQPTASSSTTTPPGTVN